MNVYVIRDLKAQAYAGAYSFDNDDIAKRAFLDAFVSGQVPTIKNHPEDFQLYRLCSYDEKTGACKKDFDFVCNFLEFVDVAKGQ